MSLISNIKDYTRPYLINMGGWQTNRKIVVIESDDWGSIRMPSKETYNSLLAKGIRVDKSPYTRFDSLENSEDFHCLFNILSQYKDQNGNHPIFTVNTVMANPDFQKIEESDYNTYYYKIFTTNYKESKDYQDAIKAFEAGISNKYIMPQFHGREHLNVQYWLKRLRENDYIFKEAFKSRMFGISTDKIADHQQSIQATFDYLDKNHLPFLENSIYDGLSIFKRIFGFNSFSFIPNNYIFPEELFDCLSKSGVKIFQGMKYQILPRGISKKRRMLRRHQGQVNKYGLLELVRNCHFEPSINGVSIEKEINRCFYEVKNAFLWNKPAIISTHRINYIGSLSEENRTSTLNGLDALLKKIINKYPNVEFISSPDLGAIIQKETK